MDQVGRSKPIMALDVTLLPTRSEGAASGFSYKDTLSVPRVDMYNDPLIRSKVLEYDDMLVFDEVTGISVRPLGFLSGIFAVLGNPDLKQTRIGATPTSGRSCEPGEDVPGISKTGTCDDRAGRARARAHPIGPAGPGHPGSSSCSGRSSFVMVSLRVRLG